MVQVFREKGRGARQLGGSRLPCTAAGIRGFLAPLHYDPGALGNYQVLRCQLRRQLRPLTAFRCALRLHRDQQPPLHRCRRRIHDGDCPKRILRHCTLYTSTIFNGSDSIGPLILTQPLYRLILQRYIPRSPAMNRDWGQGSAP